MPLTTTRNKEVTHAGFDGSYAFHALPAREAVSQWRYEPTLLNGEKVEVVTTITVNFKLK